MGGGEGVIKLFFFPGERTELIIQLSGSIWVVRRDIEMTQYGKFGEINLKRSPSLTSHSSSTTLHAKLQVISLPDPSPQGILTDGQIQSTSAGAALNIPTYVTSCVFPCFSQTNPLAHPYHLL